MSMNGNDISSLYMDDGYLFFQINPVETEIDGQFINLEMRINEGQSNCKQCICNWKYKGGKIM